MKKLLVILLTVALTFTFATLAFAGTSTYMGGEVYFFYSSANPSTDPLTADYSGGNNQIIANISTIVEADNTWAKISWDFNNWNHANSIDAGSSNVYGNGKFNYALGVKNIGDVFDIAYYTGDPDTTLTGQIPLWGTNHFGGDPFFCHRDPNVLSAKIHTDALAINVEYQVNDAAGNAINMSAKYNFDGGDFHLGYRVDGDYIVGAKFKAGDTMTIAADYYAASATNTMVQGNVAFDQVGNATLFYNLNNSEIGVGGEYTGIDKLTLGAKYFTKSDNREVYAIYKVGVLDLRLGYQMPQTGDGIITLGAHAAMW